MSRILLVLLILFSGLVAFGQDEEGPKVAAPLPAKSTLHARVFYEDTGRPVRRTSVVLMARSGGVNESSGITDEQGNLEIHNLRAGKYYPVINAPGVVSPLAYIDQSRTRSDTFDEQLAPFTPIVVDGLSDVVVQMPARRGGAIGGRITYSNGDAAIGVKVEILRKVGEDFLASIPNLSVLASAMTGGAGTFKTDDRGIYRFAGLPAGEYLVKVSEQVVHATNKKGREYEDPFTSMLFGTGSMLTVFFENTFDRNKARLLVVEFGQEQSEINIVIPDRDLHTLTGKVVAAKDKLPIRNAKVSISLSGEGRPTVAGDIANMVQSGSTDNTGEWKFVDLPKGVYQITVEAQSSEFDENARAYGTSDEVGPNGYSDRPSNVMRPASNMGPNDRGPRKPPARKFAKKVTEFTIDEKDVAEQSIELTYGGAVSGTVTVDGKDNLPSSINITLLNEGSGLSSATSIYSYDYQDGSIVQSKKRDFTIDGVAVGSTSLSFRINNPEYYVKSAMAGTVDLIKGPIDLKDNDEIRNVQIVVSNETGTLTGTILDADKQPMANLQISLVPTDNARLGNPDYYKQVMTDENGEFEIKLPPFEYAMLSLPANLKSKGREDRLRWLTDAIKNAQKFKVDSGKATKVTIKLEPTKSGK